ncbi:MAG: low-complexity protein, partial [Cyanobacteria bacterium J06623_1]
MKDRTDSAANINLNINSDIVELENGKADIDEESISFVKTESAGIQQSKRSPAASRNTGRRLNLSQSQLILITLCLMGLGLWFRLPWLGLTSAITALCLSLGVVFGSVRGWVIKFLTVQERRTILAFIGFIGAIAGLFNYLGVYGKIGIWLTQFKYDEFGSWA